MADENANPQVPSDDIEIAAPEAGIAPERPRIRRLNQKEIEQWAKAIHTVSTAPDGKQRGWVPQLRSAFAHLMPFVDEACPTAYTDCRYRIGLGPHLLDPEQTTLEQLACIVLHETMHNTQHHRERLIDKKGLNAKLTNFATDLEINGIIAEGVFGITLARPESPQNGNWDYFLGEFRQLNDKQAKKVNEAKNGNGELLLGREYASGDWIYQGCLIPSHGQFHDFPTNNTAEQYLGLLECEVEEMTLDEFKNMMSQEGQGSEGGEGAEGDGGTAGEDGAAGGDGGAGTEGQGEGGSSTGDEGCASDSGEQGDGDGTGNGADGTDGDSSDSAGSSFGGASSGGASSSGSGARKTKRSLSDPGDGNMSDGYGGNAQDTGDGHVQVTHIYKRNADGSRTEVGRDAIVDDVGTSLDSDVWEEASKLGINPITRGEEQKVRDQIAHDIEEFRRSNAFGSGHADVMLNYIERGLRPPVVNWKKMIRSCISRACQEQAKGRDDYTYRQINRRYSQEKFIFPGTTSYVPTIRFALDTSGSMSADEYYNALSEADAILKTARAKIQFCCWDGEQGEVKKVKSLKEIKSGLQGGGGTDPSVTIYAIKEEKPKDRPDVLVIATDGCFDWQNLAESLAEPEMKKIIPMVIVVYPFTEDNFYSRQGQLREYQELLRKYHRKAQVLQAWSTR